MEGLVVALCHGHRGRLWRKGLLGDGGMPTVVAPMVVGDEAHGHKAVRHDGDLMAVFIDAEHADGFAGVMGIGLVFVAGELGNQVVLVNVAVVEIEGVVVDEEGVEHNLHALARSLRQEVGGVILVMVVSFVFYVGVAVAENDVTVSHVHHLVAHVDDGAQLEDGGHRDVVAQDERIGLFVDG